MKTMRFSETIVWSCQAQGIRTIQDNAKIETRLFNLYAKLTRSEKWVQHSETPLDPLPFNADLKLKVLGAFQGHTDVDDTLIGQEVIYYTTWPNTCDVRWKATKRKDHESDQPRSSSLVEICLPVTWLMYLMGRFSSLTAHWKSDANHVSYILCGEFQLTARSCNEYDLQGRNKVRWGQHM